MLIAAVVGTLAALGVLAPDPPRMPAAVEGYFTSRRGDARPVARGDAPELRGTWRYVQAGDLPFELTITHAGDHLWLEIEYLRPPGRVDFRPTIRGPGYLVRVGTQLLIAAELDVEPAYHERNGLTAIELEVIDDATMRLTKRIGVDRTTRAIIIVSSLGEAVRRWR